MRVPTAKLAVVALVTVLLASCATPGTPLPPSLELPKPVNDLRALRKGDKVYLAWTIPTETTDRQTVRHLGATRICRSLEVALSQCGTPVGEVPSAQLKSASPTQNAANKPQAGYSDTLPAELQQRNPTALLTYAVEVLNTDHRSAGLSNQVQAPATPTLPPPDDFKAEVTAEGVVLTWTGILHEHETLDMRHLYRVYRRQEGSNSDVVAGEVQLSSLPQARLVDHSFEWEKTYYYRLTVVTLIPQAAKPEMQVEGEDTATIKVFADDVFPPAVPSGLQAVFSGVGQQPFVDLIWTPGTEADLAGYNIYRREEGGPPAKLNADLVKAPAYRDPDVQSGKKYFYSVTAVDLRGNESARSEEASEQAP